MPSNSNGRVSSATGDGADDVKLLGFTPSKPMYKAWDAYLTTAWAEECLGDLPDEDAPQDSLDADMRKGFKTQHLRQAIAQYIDYDLALEPPRERVSDLFGTFRREVPRNPDETQDAYKARYKTWQAKRTATMREGERLKADIAIARMEKMQSLIALGTDPMESIKQAFALYPDGRPVVKVS